MSQRSELALKMKGTLVQYCTPEKVCYRFRRVHDISWSFMLKLVKFYQENPLCPALPLPQS